MAIRCLVAAAAAVLSLAVCAQTKQPPPAFASSLPKQPREAAPALKATLGKQFSSGFVFIDGRYVQPPYRVERYGTVIRINGIQATGQIIPWEEFIKTQEGVKVTKTEIAAPEPESAPEPEPASDFSSDDFSFDPDDLFSDAPAKKQAPRPRRTPRPRKPATVTTYSLEGPFVPNDKTRGYVDKINGYRTKLDGQLRTGWCFFFGSGYSTVSGDSRVATDLLERICRAMREAPSYESFAAALRQGETATLPDRLVEELYRNRGFRAGLERRVKEARESRELQNMIDRSAL